MNTAKAALRLLTALLGLMLACAAMASVGVEYDEGADFGQYKTFAWAKGMPAPDPGIQARLREAVERELAAQGLRKTAKVPDVYVTTRTTTWRQPLIFVNELGYSGFYWRRWERLYSPTKQRYYLPIGTVTIDLLDGESKQRVWRGFAIEYLRGKPARTDKLVDRVTRKIFKRFPVEPMK